MEEACPVCYEAGVKVSLGCRHFVCNECYRQLQRVARQCSRTGSFNDLVDFPVTCPICREPETFPKEKMMKLVNTLKLTTAKSCFGYKYVNEMNSLLTRENQQLKARLEDLRQENVRLQALVDEDIQERMRRIEEDQQTNQTKQPKRRRTAFVVPSLP